MTARVSARRVYRRRTERPGSLVSPFVRHGLLLVGVAAVAYALRGYLPVEQQPAAWLAAGLVVGLLAGFIGRTWVGLLFAVLGAVLGIVIEVHVRAGGGTAAWVELTAAGRTLLGALALLVAGYAAVSVALLLPRRAP